MIAEDHDTGTRYRLLETIRQYSEERLADYGETAVLRTRHSRFYGDLLVEAASGSHKDALSTFPPRGLALMTSRVSVERDNIRSGLANAIDAGDVARAVQIVANHPHRDRANASRIGQVFSVPASRVLDLPGAAQHHDYPRVLMVAAYEALDSGNNDRVDTLCRQALKAASGLPTPLEGPPIEIDAFTLRAEASLAAGAYADAVAAYTHAAELAADGYPGIAAILLAYSVSSTLLGGGDVKQANAAAERSMTLGRQSDVPGAIVIALNALALTLVDSDPETARTLLRESVERSTAPGQEIAPAFVTASLVAGRLRDWSLALSLAGRAMYMYRGIMNPLHSAPCLAWCARALAEDRPEVARVLQAAAYSAFRTAAPVAGTSQNSATPVGSNTNFLF